MIVLDASVAVSLLLDLSPGAESIAKRCDDQPLAVPHLLDVEVVQVLRRYTLRGEVSNERARQAIDDLTDFPATRYPHGPLLQRAFDLRDNLTVYDAVYLALAEGLDATLITADAAFLQAAPKGISIELLR